MKIQRWRAFGFAALTVCGIALMAGCGVESKSVDKKLAKSNTEKSNQRKSDVKSDSNEDVSSENSTGKVVESKLPFGDVDPATAKIGNKAGNKVFAAKGVDANGKKFGLDDYEGKVILLDTWASW